MAQARYLNRMWNIAPREDGYVLTPAEEPQEVLHHGRVLLVNAKGVWECTRDAARAPVALIDCAPWVLDNVKATYDNNRE